MKALPIYSGSGQLAVKVATVDGDGGGDEDVMMVPDNTVTFPFLSNRTSLPAGEQCSNVQIHEHKQSHKTHTLFLLIANQRFLLIRTNLW